MEAIFRSVYVRRGVAFFYSLLPVVFCVSFVLFAGKDLNYDALNYHAYIPFSWLEDRLGQDFYPAGPQSYLNPFGYLFFYFLITTFSSSIFVAIFLAASHSLLIYILYFISKKLVVEAAGGRAVRVELLSLVSVVLGCSTLMLIQEIGSSFIDIYVATLNLFALYCIISMQANAKMGWAIAAGAAVGVSVAFKSIGIIYAFPLFFAFLIKLGAPARNFRLIFAFCISSLLVYVVIAGIWLLRVYQHTGNPIFPLFNNVFCSDFYYCQSISQVRFQKESLAEYFLWPIYMAMPLTWYYSELIAPDIRFLALLIVGLGLLIKIKGISLKPRSAFGLVVTFFALSFVPWIILLGNGRYAIELFVLVGPVLTLSLYKLANKKAFLCTMALVAGFQVATVLIVGKYRWAPVGFGGEWYDFSVPEDLKKHPHMFVSIDGQSASFLALKVHPKSAFINISGQLTLPFGEALKSRFDTMLNNRGAGIKVLTRAYPGEMEDWIVPWVERINLSVERVGLRVDDVDACELISPITLLDVQGNKMDREGYVVCPAIYDEEVKQRFLSEVLIYDRIFDELVETCGDWFNPKSAVTERDGRDWMRRYAGTEARVSADKHGVIWVRFSNRILPWSLGNIRSWDVDKKNGGICEYRFPKIYREAF